MRRPLVTGVGSLPHVDPVAAARFVLDTTDVPYLPQLPMRHAAEGMLTQWALGRCPCGAMGGETDAHEAFGGAAALLELLPDDARLVKTQATGPLTLGVSMAANGHPPERLWECSVRWVVAQTEAHLRWIEERRPAAEVLLVFDEPALSGLREPRFQIDPSGIERMLRGVIEGVSIPAGLHCCGDTDWGLVARLDPAWIAWDVGELRSPLQAAPELAKCAAAGSRFIWGVVPSTGTPPAGDDVLLARWQSIVGQLVLEGAPLQPLMEEALFSPGCGLAGLRVADAEAVAAQVRRLADLVVEYA